MLGKIQHQSSLRRELATDHAVSKAWPLVYLE